MGHETDTTLIDFVSDRRAPTPTAAAELAVPVRGELLAWVADQGARLTRAQTSAVETRARWLRDLSRALPRVETLVEGPAQRLDHLGDRLPRALTGLAQRRRVELSEKGGLRPALLRGRISEERRRLDQLSARLAPALSRSVAVKSERLAARGRIEPSRLARQAAQGRIELTALMGRFDRGARGQIEAQRQRLTALDRLRETLGYKATLRRGYTVVRDEAGHVLRDSVAAGAAAVLEIEFADGRLSVGAGGAPLCPRQPRNQRRNPPRKQRRARHRNRMVAGLAGDAAGTGLSFLGSRV